MRSHTLRASLTSVTMGLALTVASIAGAQPSSSPAASSAASASTPAPASTGASQAGILLLAHGGRSNWNAEVDRIAKTANAQRPVEVAFGMASRGAIQAAVDRLEARGVKEIVAVPLFISSHSSVVTSTAYLLGLRADMPEDLKMFATMDHGSHGAAPAAPAGAPAAAAANPHAGHGAAPAASADPHAAHGAAAKPVDGTLPVTHKVPVRMAQALDDDPIVAAILTDRAKTLSKDQSKEVVIVVAHGPVEDAENDRWLANMSRLAAVMRKDTTFARIDVITVRDDAGEPVRAVATKELRGLVEQARSEGHRVLIVPLLLSYGGIEAGIKKRLDGLDYTMGAQGLLPDERLATWVLESAAKGKS